MSTRSQADKSATLAIHTSNNGHVKDYEVHLSEDAQMWNAPVAKGSFNPEASGETIHFEKPVTARYLKLMILNGQHGRPFAGVAGLEIQVAKP